MLVKKMTDTVIRYNVGSVVTHLRDNLTNWLSKSE